MTSSIRSWLSRACATEELFSCENEGERIFGTLRLPGQTPTPAVIIAHGFTGSRNADMRMLVWAARALAHNGIASLALDFRGSGASEGDFADMTPETEISDLRAALDALCRDPRIDGERLGLVGHSLGGLVSACTSGDDPRVGALVLWCPVADSTFFRIKHEELREKHGCEADFCDVGGLLAGRALYETGLAMDVQGRFAKGTCPLLLLHGTEDAVIPMAQSELFLKTADQTGREVCLHRIQGAGHCFNRVDWREELIGHTLGWMRRVLCG